MSELAGQTDIFDELGELPPAPPFTVHTCVWASRGCGWCHSKNVIGGGACRNPQDNNESFYYDYCQGCENKYGSPRVTAAGYPLTIDRTQAPRPGPQPRKE
jgi:hypothetical protein